MQQRWPAVSGLTLGPYWADVHTVHWAGVCSFSYEMTSCGRSPVLGRCGDHSSEFLKTWEAGWLGLGKGLMSGNGPRLGAAGSSNSFM